MPSPIPPWPQYPNIPVYLDPYDGSAAPDIVPNGRSPRYLIVQSPPPPPKSTPDMQTTSYQPPRRPPLRYFLDNNSPAKRSNGSHARKSVRRSSRPYLSFDGSPQADKYTRNHGLGIINTKNDHPPSLIASSFIAKDDANFAQRLEKRIWHYNMSRNAGKRWLLEYISWMVSAASIAAIVGVLIYLDDETLPKWPLGLTLNAYIAILAKISGAALLLPVTEALGQLKWSWFQGESKEMWDFEIFDNASRGPWGAFLLLMLLIRAKARSLAALGAILVIFTLALDAFFQQVVDFPERWRNEGWNSTVPSVVLYTPKAETLLEAPDGLRRAETDPDLRDVASKFFYENGTQPMVFGNGARAEIPISCPTSNCTWPIYETLGFCSSCVEVSQIVSFTCLRTTVDWIGNLTAPSNGSAYPNATVCGYFLNATTTRPTLMSGFLTEPINSATGMAQAGEALLGRTLPLFSMRTTAPLFGGSIHFKNIRNPIVDVLISGNQDIGAVYRNETPVVHECVLSWCVKSIKSSYYWASYEEEIVQKTFNNTAGPFPISQRRSTATDGTNSTVIQYEEDVFIQASGLEGVNQTYMLSNVSASRTILLFAEVFPSFTTANNESGTESTRFQSSSGKPIRRLLADNPWLPPNNVTNHMEKLASAFTNVIRSSERTKTIDGMAFSKENYVAVRWAWLALPLALLAFSFIFLVATVIKSSQERDRVGIWKTSALATLLYGLPDDMQTKLTSSSTETPRSKAKTLRVKMLSKCWRISGSLFTPVPRVGRKQQRPPGWI